MEKGSDLNVKKDKQAKSKSFGDIIHNIRSHAQNMAPFITLIVLILFFTIFSVENRFIKGINIMNILQQASTLAILATGVTYVLLIGEIDLSVGGTATASGVMAAFLFVSHNWPGWACVLAAILLSVVVGLINGLITAYIGVPSFMTTLAMGSITTGIAVFLTKGRPIFDVPEISSALGSGSIGPIRTIIIVAAVFIILGWFISKYTRFGRYVYMVGGSRQAATLSGINSKRIITIVMMVSATLAGISGVINVGRLGSANPDIFTTATMDTIAAVVLGGTSLFGGVGSVASTVIGLLVFAVLNNGLNLVRIDVYLKTFITGVVLLLALLLNVGALRIGEAERELIIEEEEDKTDQEHVLPDEV